MVFEMPSIEQLPRGTYTSPGYLQLGGTFSSPQFGDMNMRHTSVSSNPYWGDPGRDHNVLRFSYSTVSILKWMKNFWWCENATDFATCAGYIKEMAQFMADRLNMTIDLEVASADGLGSFLPNGTWTAGVTRDVIDGKADFSISVWDWARCSYTTCLDYMFETSYSVVVPLPKPKQLFTAFIEPFATSTWVALVLSFLAVGLFMASLRDRCYQDFTWLGLFATVVGQDYSEKMSTGYSRVGGGRRGWGRGKRRGRRQQELRFFPLAAWQVAVTILYVSYSAVVIDYFMTQLEDRVEDLAELAGTDYNLTCNPALTTFVDAARSHRSPAVRGLARRIRPLYNQPADYCPLPNEAYVDDETIMFLRLDSLRSQADARLKKFYTFDDKLLQPRCRTAFFNKDFPRIQDASRYSRQFVEHGFSVYFERYYLTEAVNRMQDNFKGINQREVLSPIPLKNVFGWFVGLLAGCTAAFLVFLLELVWVKCCHASVDDEHYVGQMN